MNKSYVQYGCGLSAPKEWINFDASPTLRIQKTPLLNVCLKPFLKVKFPDNVRYGNIIKGLPIPENSCNGVYCSHILEHLSYDDFQKALLNTYKILKPGGIFRLVMPDLELFVNDYLNKKNRGEQAAFDFNLSTGFGQKSRATGFKAVVLNSWGNSRHLWLWDTTSAIEMLKKTGFTGIRTCVFNDCNDPMFAIVESKDRFTGAMAIEAVK